MSKTYEELEREVADLEQRNESQYKTIMSLHSKDHIPKVHANCELYVYNKEYNLFGKLNDNKALWQVCVDPTGGEKKVRELTEVVRNLQIQLNKLSNEYLNDVELLEEQKHHMRILGFAQALAFHHEGKRWDFLSEESQREYIIVATTSVGVIDK